MQSYLIKSRSRDGHILYLKLDCEKKQIEKQFYETLRNLGYDWIRSKYKILDYK